ncbi:MAG: class I SAM-dependent methyltransferase [Patescibacteria group bacterium]
MNKEKTIETLKSQSSQEVINDGVNQDFTDRKSCLICSTNGYNVLISYNKPDQYERACGLGAEGYSRRWVECRRCGFIYSLYSRNKNIFDKLYETVYKDSNSYWRRESGDELFQKIINLSDSESETKFRVKWIKDNISRLQNDQIINVITSPRSFLDIGGGSGIFAHEFKDDLWSPYVVDPDARGVFMEKYGIKFIKSYYQPNLFSVKFDLVSLIYVLEHLENPKVMMHDLHDDMEQGALLYIEVPDSICFQCKDQQDDIFNSCHLWMFNPYTLSELLHKTGFELVALQRMKTVRNYYGLMVLAIRR